MIHTLAILPAPFVNDAGKIQNLLELYEDEDPVRGVAIIESKAGSRRSSHYHKRNGHWLYVVSGSMLYTERRFGSGTVLKYTVRPGEMVFTPPQVEHWTEFKEDTVLVSLSKHSKRHDQHEADVVRVPWIEET